MKNANNNITLDSTNAFLNETFTHLDLNQDIQKLYTLLNDQDLQEDFDKKVYLTNLRNENYKRYNDIKIVKYKELPKEFSDLVDDIFSFYEYINVRDILTDNYEDSKNNKIILDNIYRRIYRLDNVINSYLKQLTKENDEAQKKFSRIYFNNLNIDKDFKKDLIEKYNDLVLHSSKISSDLYEELSIQVKRKEYIDEILKSLNIFVSTNTKLVSEDILNTLNILINIKINQYNNKIYYLEDLLPRNSKHAKEFSDFKHFYNKLIAYDDTDYENARQTFDILNDTEKMNNYINNFEAMFINERTEIKKEEQFIYEKIGIKNLKTSLNYINENYGSIVSEEDKNIVRYVFKQLNNSNYDINDLNAKLKSVVDNIWKTQITDVYQYDPQKEYYFICSNNQFIDEKYQTILITKKEIEKVNDYEDYQIGFICGYNDNIMYITENDDIMTVDKDDMSNLKTPLQLEEEFMNFKICNRIALNGYKTKIEAVYYINDGNEEKYMKALDLSNMYKIPLIEFKKDNQ